MEKLIIEEDYVIELDEIVLQKLKLRQDEIKKFKNLGIKTKMSRLNYLKSVRSKEEEIAAIVAQSRFLRLLRDNSGVHLRYEPYLEAEEKELEKKIVDYILDRYSFIIDEEVNDGMSGDKNRILISKGTQVEID